MCTSSSGSIKNAMPTTGPQGIWARLRVSQAAQSLALKELQHQQQCLISQLKAISFVERETLHSNSIDVDAATVPKPTDVADPRKHHCEPRTPQVKSTSIVTLLRPPLETRRVACKRSLSEVLREGSYRIVSEADDLAASELSPMVERLIATGTRTSASLRSACAIVQKTVRMQSLGFTVQPYDSVVLKLSYDGSSYYHNPIDDRFLMADCLDRVASMYSRTLSLYTSPSATDLGFALRVTEGSAMCVDALERKALAAGRSGVYPSQGQSFWKSKMKRPGGIVLTIEDAAGNVASIAMCTLYRCVPGHVVCNLEVLSSSALLNGTSVTGLGTCLVETCCSLVRYASSVCGGVTGYVFAECVTEGSGGAYWKGSTFRKSHEAEWIYAQLCASGAHAWSPRCEPRAISVAA